MLAINVMIVPEIKISKLLITYVFVKRLAGFSGGTPNDPPHLLGSTGISMAVSGNPTLRL
jgi:hypothetical protein